MGFQNGVGDPNHFGPDSFLYLSPKRPEYRPVDIRINHNTTINFNGPSSSAVKTGGICHAIGGGLNFLASILLPKDGIICNKLRNRDVSIWNLSSGGSYSGGYNPVASSGYLLDSTFYSPVSFSGSGDGDGTKKTSDKPVKTEKPDKPDKTEKPDKPDKTEKPDKPNKTEKPDKPTVYPKPNEDGYADFFNSVIDDTFDKDGDGKHGTMGADGKVTGLDNDDIFYAEAWNTSNTSLEHTTSKTSDHGGIKRGISKGKYPEGEDASTKSKDGFYKYITLTDKNSNNEWTFTYSGKDASGNPIYTFSTTYSDLSKDDNGTDKGWEQTGKQPNYTVTIDVESGKIKMNSTGNDYAATKHN